MNLRDGLTEARRLGCTVSTVHCSGEIRVVAPVDIQPSRRINMNNRKKDASKAFEVFLRRVREALKPKEA